MFFFFFNNENRIGFKKLTGADLGISETSHQSHIGLYEGVLEFLDDSDVVRSAMLIYGDYCNVLDCSFDRIKNPDGSYRSPKIRIGQDSDNSVVSKIRGFAREYPNDDWYLAWMGLESKELVFWLVKSSTTDYDTARNFFPKDKIVLQEDSPTYNAAKDYLLNRINFLSVDVQKDIEVKSLIGDSRRKYKVRDLENAERQFKLTGKEGEELVAQFLEREKLAKRVESFVWENKSYESGLPYDFIVNGKIFVDVKSTRFDFEQFLFYSNQEIDFAAAQNNLTYAVYRVFDMNMEQRKLSICNNCQPYMKSIQQPIVDLKNAVRTQHALMQSIKLGLKPSICFNEISNPILL
ncbi:MAG: DUF3883 domain-containing protein [Bacteroidales bacterium]|nr:DUF3883 domain-containing protein [Bacteroidales bacterium]